MRPLGPFAAALLAAALVAGACSGDGPTDDPTAGPAPADAAAATWPLVDAVPSHRKPGVLVRIGLDALSLVDADGVERSTRLVVAEPDAMFAISPARGGAVPFDAIELAASSEDGVDLWPFVLGADGRMVRFAAADRLDVCTALDASATVSAVESDERLDGRFPIDVVECRPLASVDGGLRGMIESDGPVRLFGLWVHVDPVAVESALPVAVDVSRLALVDTTERLDSAAPLRVEVVGLDTTVAARTADPADDAGIAAVTVLDAEGTVATVPLVDDVAEVDVTDLVGPVRLSVDDLGLLHHPLQGGWIDPAVVSRSLLIDATPEFTPTESSPEAGTRASGAHVLTVWRGSVDMERQEYEGLTFRNNLGQADRDRVPDGTCRRAAYLGGSFVEAIQTRVDQKPAIVAEAILATTDLGCVEVFTYASDTFTVENHLGNARTLVEDFGVEVLVFSVSGLEVCRMDDLVYADSSGVDPTTPIRWRYVDGEILEPVSRREAIEVDAVPGFSIADRCDFATEREDEAASVETALVAKLVELRDVIAGFGPGVSVRFTNVKDVVVGLDGNVAGLERRCVAAELDCAPLELPHPRVASVPVTDATDYLYRFQYDAHPNVRANQLIGAHLADLVADALQSPAAG